MQAHGEYSNQNFKLFTFFIDDEDFEVFIFNRWGEMVHHTTERDFRWNGGYNNNPGQPLPTGTYTYVVRYRIGFGPLGLIANRLVVRRDVERIFDFRAERSPALLAAA